MNEINLLYPYQENQTLPICLCVSFVCVSTRTMNKKYAFSHGCLMFFG